MAGRKSKYCEEISMKIADFIREGLTIKDACYGVDISTDTFIRWRNRYPEFNKLIQEASRREWGTAAAVAKYDYRGYRRKEAYNLPKSPENPTNRFILRHRWQSSRGELWPNTDLLARFTVSPVYPCKPYINGNNGKVEWRDKQGVVCTCTYEKHLEKKRYQKDSYFFGIVI